MDFKILLGFRDFTWISRFYLDFEILLGFQVSEWISKWIFGFRLNFYYSRFYLDFRFQISDFRMDSKETRDHSYFRTRSVVNKVHPIDIPECDRHVRTYIARIDPSFKASR